MVKVNEDGSPRAKARLIVRGYADVDALQGSLETSSPTTTRLPELSALTDVYAGMEVVDIGHCNGILTRTSSRAEVVGQASI